MDNLFLKVHYPSSPPNRKALFPNLVSAAPAETKQGQRYVTRVTLEGDNRGPAGGLWADSDVLVEECVFSQLGGPRGGIGRCGECRAALIAKAHVTVHNSRFDNPLEEEPGSLYVLAVDGGGVLIERSRFMGATAVARIERGNSSGVYSDDPRVLLLDHNGAQAPVADISSFPQVPADGQRFLAGDDDWLDSVRQVLEAGGGPADGCGISPPSPSPLGPIVGAVCATVLLAAVAAALLLLRRRRKRAAAAPHSAGPQPRSHTISQDGTQTPQSGAEGGTQSHISSPFPLHAGSPVPSLHNSVASSTGAASGYASMPFSSMYVRSGTHEAPTITETFNSAAPTTGPPPSVDAPLPAKLDYLHSQLNQFGKDDILLGRFTLLGETQRRQGGQGVVAFAVGADDRLEYAIKFFVVHSSYIAERQLYESRVLGALLPKVEDVYDPALSPSRLLDRNGRPLPPCIAMERGESLNEWSRRAKPDVFQAVAVLAHVATRLRDMHQAGYVHRDIKPSNIMLLPRENRWTVIDFGSAAEVGAVSSLSYTLVYAAPEVADAGAAGVRTIVADPAIDAWALGVVAFELLTGTSTFDMLHDGKPSVIAQLRGLQELPWEGERLRRRPDLRRRLGVFKRPVLALLHRDPVRRSSMEEFCSACDSLFSGPTTAQAP